MMRYIGVGLVIAILIVVTYNDHANCNAAGGVLLRTTFETVCVRKLEIVR